MPDIPYYLTREWCAAHGRKTAAQLSAENGGSASTWRDRKARMRELFPEQVPMLDKHGRVEVTPAEGVSGFEATEECVEILDGGGYRSTKPLLMFEAQSKDKAYLLEAHGFDATEWEVVNAKSKTWNVKSDQDGIAALYSSAITVRPLVAAISIEAIAQAVRDVEPVTVKRPKAGARCLELADVDTHFGNSDFAWYADTLARICGHIESRKWAQVVVPIGSDHFHTDNFKNTTSNGTAQSSMSWPDAWADAARYDSAKIEAALANSRTVFAYYVIGNHDESMSWAYCQYLAAKYPQVVFDLDIAERKVHVFGEVAIGLTHGDCRNRKDLDRVFMSEFPSFASARVREVHAAHYHHEVSVDQFGVITRSLSTAARTDKWHREEGFVGAMKRFQVFEWERDSLSAIHYV